MTNYYYYYYSFISDTSSKNKQHEARSIADPGAPGGIPEPCPPKWLLVPPPNENCVPPSEDCAPKKLTESWQLECKSRPKLVFFVDWQRISWRFWDEDLFLEITCFRPEKLLEFAISGGKSPAISVKTFFLRSSVSGRKIPLNLCFSPCSLDPDWDKFLVPLLNSHKINCSCPLYFCPPPVTLFCAAGPGP